MLYTLVLVRRLEGRWKLGESGLSLAARYSCPLDNMERFWEPPSRLMIRLDYSKGRGIHVGPFGIDIDEKLFSTESGMTYLRAAGSIGFPRQIPVGEGEAIVNYNFRRLGLKAKW